MGGPCELGRTSGRRRAVTPDLPGCSAGDADVAAAKVSKPAASELARDFVQ